VAKTWGDGFFRIPFIFWKLILYYIYLNLPAQTMPAFVIPLMPASDRKRKFNMIAEDSRDTETAGFKLRLHHPGHMRFKLYAERCRPIIFFRIFLG
jgi:hypothetical protein